VDISTVQHKNDTISTEFSGANAGATDTAQCPGSAVFYGNNDHVSSQAESRVPFPYKEKRTLPGTCADNSRYVYIAALESPESNPVSVLRFRNFNLIPFH